MEKTQGIRKKVSNGNQDLTPQAVRRNEKEEFHG